MDQFLQSLSPIGRGLVCVAVCLFALLAINTMSKPWDNPDFPDWLRWSYWPYPSIYPNPLKRCECRGVWNNIEKKWEHAKNCRHAANDLA